VARSNVLLIMVDQLAASWLPAYGHDVVQSPSITALADEGVVLESAYCPSPLCAPSRSSLLTGRLPSRTGVYDDAAEMRASEPTVTHRIRAAGYDTCLSGKMHFVGPDQLHGFEQRLTTDVYPADLDPWELRARYWDRYEPAAIELPAVGPIPRAEADPHSLRLRDMSGIDEAPLSEQQVRRARHGYYAAISYVDELIGRVLGALADSGLRDDTTVLFTADHGEMLGERGLWYKMAFFEAAAQDGLLRGRGSRPVDRLRARPARCGARG